MSNPYLLDRTRQDIYARAMKVIQTAYPDWSDADVASFQNIIINVVASIGDSVNYYQNATSDNITLATATTRDAAIAHAQSLGYNVRGTAPAEGTVLVTLDRVITSDLIIAPQDITFSTLSDPPVEFEVPETTVIRTGVTGSSFYLPVKNAFLTSEIVVSNGSANQTYTLRRSPYIEGSIVVTAGGVAYTPVRSLIEAGPTDNFVKVSVTTGDRLLVEFGDGTNGAIPSGQITFQYQYGGGRFGSVETNTIRGFSKPNLKDINGNAYQIVSVTNTESTQGGQDRETIASIKERAPRSRVTASKRTVSHADYVNNAYVSGVSRVFLMSHRNANLAPNELKLIIIPSGAEIPSAALKTRVLRAVTVDNPNSPLDQVSVHNPIYKIVNIRGVVQLKQGATRTNTRLEIEKRFKEFFAPEDESGVVNSQVMFGSEYRENGQEPKIPFGTLFTVLQTAPGVFSVTENPSDFLVNEAHEDVLIGDLEFPKMGTILLVDASDGTEF